MRWLQRLAGVLVAPRRSFEELIAGRSGGIGDVLGFMFLVMLGVQPADTAQLVLSGSRGVLPAAARLVQQFALGFALQPLLVTLALGLVLAGLLRLRGRKVAIDGMLTAATYLWVPVGALAILGALLVELGWRQALFPHVPLDVFFRLEPSWWQVALRLVLSYGPSAWLAWLLWRTARAEPGEPPRPAARRGWAGWALAGWLLVSWTGGAVWAVSHYDLIRPLMPGDPALAFDLPRAAGQGRVSLAGLRGQPVVVEFWADWCSVCRRHMPEMERWAAAHPQVPYLAVHQGGTPGEVAAFVRKQGWHGLTFLVDEHESASRAYRVDTLPTYFVVDASGRLLGIRVGAASPTWLDGVLGLKERG